MTLSSRNSAPHRSRIHGIGETILVLGLMATVAWTTLNLGGYLPQTMVVTSVAIFGLTILAALLGWPGNARLNPVAWLPVPFLLFALVSVWWLAPARWLAWREWLLGLQTWLVFFLTLHFGRGRKLTTMLVAVLAGLGLAAVFMAAYQRFVNPAWMMMGRIQVDQFLGRSAGMFGVPNSLAGLLELMIPVCLTLLFARATGLATKLVSSWLALLFIFALGLTGSRGGWVAVGLALLLWPLLGSRRWPRRLGGVAIVFVVAAVGAIALFQFSPRARARLEPFLAGQVEPSRPLLWRAGLQIWLDHPVAGSGAASYNVVFDRYRPRAFLDEPQWAHNDYLNVLSDYGVIGLALWAGAGIGLTTLGWRAVGRTRESGRPTGSDPFASEPWRLGLLLGWVAFAFHLAVDFHTKIPALSFLAAAVTGLLLREDQTLPSVMPRWPAWLLAFTAVAGGIVAWPLYRSEALRDESRRSIDRRAAGTMAGESISFPEATANFQRAVAIDPSNGQAWSDLSYALTLGWQGDPKDLVAVGKNAEAAAARAIELCPVNAEYWIRRGVALDMQAKPALSEGCFRRALELAPNRPAWWYYYAYHLQDRRGREAEARAAVETCLTLDPSNSAAVFLRQQLAARR